MRKKRQPQNERWKRARRRDDARNPRADNLAAPRSWDAAARPKWAGDTDTGGGRQGTGDCDVTRTAAARRHGAGAPLLVMRRVFVLWRISLLLQTKRAFSALSYLMSSVRGLGKRPALGWLQVTTASLAARRARASFSGERFEMSGTAAPTGVSEAGEHAAHSLG